MFSLCWICRLTRTHSTLYSLVELFLEPLAVMSVFFLHRTFYQHMLKNDEFHKNTSNSPPPLLHRLLSEMLPRLHSKTGRKCECPPFFNFTSPIATITPELQLHYCHLMTEGTLRATPLLTCSWLLAIFGTQLCTVIFMIEYNCQPAVQILMEVI